MTEERSRLARSGTYISLCLMGSGASFLSSFFVDDAQVRYALLASLAFGVHIVIVTR